VEGLLGVCDAELERDAAPTDTHDGADLEKLEPERIDLRLG
jgi:hypothetical protein